jgi:prephenate dehydratase
VNITYLGPAGATFSAIVYDKLAESFGAPVSSCEEVKLSLARTNEEIVPLLIQNGGFGAIAMETKVGGIVGPPLNSLIKLLEIYDRWSDEDPPIRVYGALAMKISFALMVKPGTKVDEIKIIHAHPRALEACRKNLNSLKCMTVESVSNGQAAEDVNKSDSSDVAALGPAQAAKKYGLEIINTSFEDVEVVTTFLLLGPQSFRDLERKRSVTEYQSIVVFRLDNEVGALLKALEIFRLYEINLNYIASLHQVNGCYDFAIQIKLKEHQIRDYKLAMDSFHCNVKKSIRFGPFPVISE